jgi:hypothetical protein
LVLILHPALGRVAVEGIAGDLLVTGRKEIVVKGDQVRLVCYNRDPPSD